MWRKGALYVGLRVVGPGLPSRFSILKTRRRRSSSSSVSQQHHDKRMNRENGSTHDATATRMIVEKNFGLEYLVRSSYTSQESGTLEADRLAYCTGGVARSFVEVESRHRR